MTNELFPEINRRIKGPPCRFVATTTLLATAAVIGAVGAGTAGIVSAAKGGGGGSGDAPPVGTVPQPKSFAEIEADERKKLLQSKQSATKNVLTTPLGVTDSGSVAKKVLLGA